MKVINTRGEGIVVKLPCNPNADHYTVSNLPVIDDIEFKIILENPIDPKRCKDRVAPFFITVEKQEGTVTQNLLLKDLSQVCLRDKLKHVVFIICEDNDYGAIVKLVGDTPFFHIIKLVNPYKHKVCYWCLANNSS